MVGVKIPRVGVKITRGILTPGGQAAQGVKINCYTGLNINKMCNFVMNEKNNIFISCVLMVLSILVLL